MTVLMHISDPHFGTEQAPVVEALVRLVHEQAPEVIVLSGDITQRALRSQFRAARLFTDRLQVPAMLAIPGNHDIPLFNLPLRFCAPYARYRHAFGDDLEPILETAQLLIVALNTTRRYRHVDGEVSIAQIERAAYRLQHASPQQLRIVVTHQPIHVIYLEDEPDRLHGRMAAIRRWAEAGADLILGGHIHRPYVVALHEQFAGLPRRVWAVQAGTAVSSRIRHDAGNSVNLIRYDAPARHCRVERWDYVGSAQSFVQMVNHELALDATHHAV